MQVGKLNDGSEVGVLEGCVVGRSEGSSVVGASLGKFDDGRDEGIDEG